MEGGEDTADQGLFKHLLARVFKSQPLTGRERSPENESRGR